MNTIISWLAFVSLMQVSQLPLCKDPSANAKCDKTQRSAVLVLVLGTRAPLELQLRAGFHIDGVLEEKPL